MTSLPASVAPGLRWLIRLRWMALAGQVLLFLAGALFLGIALPLNILISCLAVTVASNVLATMILVTMKGDRLPERACCALLLLLDTLTLTVLLYWLGGAHNPFTAFYLLHITIAAVLLPAAWAWFGVVLCGLCYGMLFRSPHELVSSSGMSCCGDLDYHLQGMLLAMVLVGMCIAFFVGQLKTVLARQEAELVEARLLAVRNEKFAGLATLAAGVAHELATPLSTIAVVSSDMENQAGSECQNSGCVADARLIRSEVERCRNILEKLGVNAANNIRENPQRLSLGDVPERLREFLSDANFSRLSAEIPDPQAVIVVPITTLLQSLSVMVKNACEADEAGNPVVLSLSVEGAGVTAVVRDRGAGMPPEVSTRAGEPFFTTKEPGKGMGLGLFLVRMFAERMKGRLIIQSEPGQGSTVCLEFPISQWPS